MSGVVRRRKNPVSRLGWWAQLIAGVSGLTLLASIIATGQGSDFFREGFWHWVAIAVFPITLISQLIAYREQRFTDWSTPDQ